MPRLNRITMNLLEKFQELINEYNSAAINIEVFFYRLIAFAEEDIKVA